MNSNQEARIRVLWPSGRLAYHCGEDQARQLHRASIGKWNDGKKLHTIYLFEGPERPRAGTTYSHKGENPTNIANVWQLRALVPRCPTSEERSKVERYVRTIFRLSVVEPMYGRLQVQKALRKAS